MRASNRYEPWEGVINNMDTVKFRDLLERAATNVSGGTAEDLACDVATILVDLRDPDLPASEVERRTERVMAYWSVTRGWVHYWETVCDALEAADCSDRLIAWLQADAIAGQLPVIQEAADN